MNRSILTIAAIFIACSFVGSTVAQDRRVLSEAERITGDRFAVSIRTPKGANVYAVNKPSATVLNAIDQGLTDLFAVARKNGYYKRLNYSDYSVFIGLADRTKDYQGQYSPDIRIPVAQYAGTVFDKGGYMYAAGMVISTDPCAFVIAEHTRDYERVSNVVRYEGEHLILYHNDPARFAATADHSHGGSHPILQ
jgi:ABC-type antimicrobial peptide transport system permease subunit